MIKVKRINNFADIGEKTWSEILATSDENYIFQTYEFINAWWRHFGNGRGRRESLLLIVENGGFPVAIAPLMLKKLKFLRYPIIEFIGTDICDYMNFIVNDNDYEKYLLKIIEHLSGLSFLEIDLKYISGDWKMMQKFDTINRTRNMCGRISQVDACPYIDLRKDWQDIVPGLKRKLRWELRRHEEGLRKKGDLVFKTYKHELDLKKILNDYFNLHVKKWKHYDKKYSQFQYRCWREFVTELSYAISDKGWLDLSYLEFNGKMIACHFGFAYRGRLYYYMPAYDPDLADYSPAKILIMKMLEHSYKTGLGEFDFLRGLEMYKSAWTAASRPLYRMNYYPKEWPLRHIGFFYRAVADEYAKSLKPMLKKIEPLMKMWYNSKGDNED